MSLDHCSTYDVIIAGAGPVGLFLACELGLTGCRVLVLERGGAAELPLKRLPFGLRGLNLPTMDSLDRRDLLAPLQARVAVGDAAMMPPWTTGKRRPAGHFAGLQFFRDMVDEEAWPWRPTGATEMFAVTMADIEYVLLARARQLGATVRYNCGVDGLVKIGDNIEVQAGGVMHHTAWLVGCDGGRSTVRKAAGIAFAGTEPEFTGYSMALRLYDPNPLRKGRQHTATGMYTYAPTSTVTMVDFDGGVSHRATPLTRDYVQAMLRRISGTDVAVAAVELATTWTDRAFLAGCYRQGRVLLAGDAAHVHAPLGGQGLNLGIGDAMNLGWKLAAVASGRAPLSLLDTYERERRPVAEQVLDWSRAQVALLRPDPGAAALRAVVRDVMETRDGATYFAGRAWGAQLRYEPVSDDHRLVGLSVPDLTLAGGGRLNEALRGGQALVVHLERAAPLHGLTDASDGLACDAADPLGDPDVATLLVRPDGVIAWAGTAYDRDGLARSTASFAGLQLRHVSGIYPAEIGTKVGVEDA